MTGGEGLDVIVVGAGPAGSRTAELLARRGLRVLILEEHQEVGRPISCAGLLSTRVFDLLGGGAVAVQNWVSGAAVHGPGGRTVAFDAGCARAAVVDRAAFDMALARRAVAAGARLRLGARAVGVRASAEGCAVEVRDRARGAGAATEVLRCRAVVGADGPGSLVRRSIGRHRPALRLQAFELRFATPHPLDTATVHLFAGRQTAPGFFAWAIPVGPNEGLVGVACEPGGVPARARVEALLRDPRFTRVFPDVSPIGAYAGTIPIGPIARPVADGALLVGDAAAQPKATSGGGVYPALEAARAAACALADALERGAPTARALGAYPKAFNEVIGAELKRAARLRRSYAAMSDAMVDQLLEAVDDPELLALVVLVGDIDFPSKLVKALLQKSPSLLVLAGPVLKGFL
jgi:geranylgeranyl reductase family protein